MTTTQTTSEGGTSFDEASVGALQDALNRARGVREACERERDAIRTSLASAESAAATADRDHMADATEAKLEAALEARAKADGSRAALAQSEQRLQRATQAERAAAARLADARRRLRKAHLRAVCSVEAYHADTMSDFLALASALGAARGAAQRIDQRWKTANQAALELRSLGEPVQPLDAIHFVAGLLRDMGETGDVSGLVAQLERSLTFLAGDGDSSLEAFLLGALDGVLHTNAFVRAASDVERRARVEELEALLSQPTRHLGIKAIQDLRFRRAGTASCVEADLAEVNRRRRDNIPPPEGFVNPGTPPFHVAGQPTPYQRKLEADAKKGVR